MHRVGRDAGVGGTLRRRQEIQTLPTDPQTDGGTTPIAHSGAVEAVAEVDAADAADAAVAAVATTAGKT